MKKLRPLYYDPLTCVDKLGRLVKRTVNGEEVQQPVNVLVPGRIHKGRVLARAIVVARQAGKPAKPATGQVAEIFSQQYDGMTQLLAVSGVGRRPNIQDWRLTKPSTGRILGVYDSGGLTILATDGVLGIFERRMADDSLSYVLAHTQKFTGEIKSLFAKSSGGPRKSKGPRKETKSARIQRLLDAV